MDLDTIPFEVDAVSAIYNEFDILENAVRKAAANMDLIVPQWHQRIDKERLDIFCPNRCILAQAMGDYMLGHTVYMNRFIPFGNHPEREREYSDMCSAFAVSSAKPFWIAEIDARLEADKKAATGRFLAKTYEIINLPAIIRKEEVSIER